MKQDILRLLIDNQGSFVSGEELSKTLGVSRTAIWKQINGLKDEGYVIESSPRRGYCLLERPDILNPEEISLGLNTDTIGKKVYVYNLVQSTNDIAKKMAEEGEAEGVVVIAEQQLKGKGRMGRAWVSSAGTGICFSLILRPAVKPALASQLTFVIAVAVFRALRNFTGLKVTIKWPNDLLLNGKKICGILTELSAEIDIINFIVAGIGINVNQREDEFPAEIKEKATSLAAVACRSFRRTDLLQEIIREIERAYKEYHGKGFAPVVMQWRELNSTLGKEVQVVSGNDSITGTAEDISEEGYLLIRTAGGMLYPVLAGDVSIRGAEGRYGG